MTRHCSPPPHGVSAMSLDAIKRRFVDEMKLRGYDDKYIDKNEEREILQIAIQQGIGIDAARAALAQVCEVEGYVLESVLLTRSRIDARRPRPRRAKSIRRSSSGSSRREDPARGRRNDRDLKKLIVLVMEDTLEQGEDRMVQRLVRVSEARTRPRHGVTPIMASRRPTEEPS